MTADLQSLRLELLALRAQVDEERAARARDTIEPPDTAVFHRPAPDLPGFFTRRYGAGGFDKVIVSPGYVITRAGASSYAEKTFTFSAAGVLYARYQIATSGGGAAWEVVSSHIIQQAASLPAHADGYVLVPIASIGWNGTDSRISTLVLHHTGTLKHIELPAGIMAPWHGSIASIPAGWAHCDGSGGTTDTRDKFIVGAGTTYAVDATGGTTTHDHGGGIEINIAHSHGLGTTVWSDAAEGVAVDVMPYHEPCVTNGVDEGTIPCVSEEGNANVFAEIDDANHLPPYVAKAWMVKL